MNSSDALAEVVFDLQKQVKTLGRAEQLTSSTVGVSDDEQVAVGDAVADAAITNDAVPVLQDDVADTGEATSDLAEILRASGEELDARFADAAVDLANRAEDLEDAQQRIRDAFGQQVQGLSDKIDTVVVGAGGSLILSAVTDPQGTAPPGSTWFKTAPAAEPGQPDRIVGQWQQTGSDDAPVWSPRQIASEVIAYVDIGKLTAGDASIADLVALEIAAATANIQTVNVGNLFVTEGATMKKAVIEALYAQVVQARKITADMIDVESLDGVTITGATIRSAATGLRVELTSSGLTFYDGSTPAGGVRALYNPWGGLVLGLGPDSVLQLGSQDMTNLSYAKAYLNGDIFVDGSIRATGSGYQTNRVISDTFWIEYGSQIDNTLPPDQRRRLKQVIDTDQVNGTVTMLADLLALTGTATATAFRSAATPTATAPMGVTGRTAVKTDANGLQVIPHSLGVVPSNVMLTIYSPRTANAIAVRVVSQTASSFTVAWHYNDAAWSGQDLNDRGLSWFAML